MRPEWARTVRTSIQVAVALVLVAPALVDSLGLDATAGVGASILAISATLARLMQVPVVNQLIQKLIKE